MGVQEGKEPGEEGGDFRPSVRKKKAGSGYFLAGSPRSIRVRRAPTHWGAPHKEGYLWYRTFHVLFFGRHRGLTLNCWTPTNSRSPSIQHQSSTRTWIGLLRAFTRKANTNIITLHGRWAGAHKSNHSKSARAYVEAEHTTLFHISLSQLGPFPLKSMDQGLPKAPKTHPLTAVPGIYRHAQGPTKYQLPQQRTRWCSLLTGHPSLGDLAHAIAASEAAASPTD